MRRTLIAAFVLTVAFAGNASAERLTIVTGGEDPIRQSDNDLVVQGNRSLVLTPAENSRPDARRNEALRMLYGLVDKECELLTETIAERCEVSALSTSISISDDPNNSKTQASVNFSLRTKLKGPKPASEKP